MRLPNPLNLCGMAWCQAMLSDTGRGKVGYWVSREYVMCLFKCISTGQGSEGSSVEVKMNFCMVYVIIFVSCNVLLVIIQYFISNVSVPALEGV